MQAFDMLQFVYDLGGSVIIPEFPWCSWLSRVLHTHKVASSNLAGNTGFARHQSILLHTSART
jgi:hypothetical protein